jgi:hypothetical protein
MFATDRGGQSGFDMSLNCCVTSSLAKTARWLEVCRKGDRLATSPTDVYRILFLNRYQYCNPYIYGYKIRYSHISYQTNKLFIPNICGIIIAYSLKQGGDEILSLEELQRLVLLAFRFGGVAGFQLANKDKTVTITFQSQEAL